MLKIKNNVDLKDLEKFGIRNGYQLKPFLEEDDEERVLSIDSESKIIDVESDLWWYHENYYGFVKKYSKRGAEDILYDLIQAGLVEKVLEVQNDTK